MLQEPHDKCLVGIEEFLGSIGTVKVGLEMNNHNCYKEMDSLFDNQNCNEDLHSIHNSKTVESHGVVANGINQLCHGGNRDLGYRQTRFLILPCHNWGNCHHYKDYHTNGKPESVDET